MAERTCVIHVQPIGGSCFTVWTECVVSSMYHCAACLTEDQVTGLINSLTERADKWSQPYTACSDGAVYPTKRNSDMTPNFDTIKVAVKRHDYTD